MEKKEISLGRKMISIVDVTIGSLLLLFALFFLISVRVPEPTPVWFILFFAYSVILIQALLGCLFIAAGFLILKSKLFWKGLNLALSILGVFATPLCYIMQLYVISEEKFKPLSIHAKILFLISFLYFIWAAIYLARQKLEN